MARLLLHGPKKNVRPGDDCLLYGDTPATVIEVDEGRKIKFSYNSGRSVWHIILPWDSPIWDRDPHKKQREHERQQYKEKLNEYVISKIGEPPSSGCYVYESIEYNDERKQVIKEYHQKQAKKAKKNKQMQEEHNAKAQRQQQQQQQQQHTPVPLVAPCRSLFNEKMRQHIKKKKKRQKIPRVEGRSHVFIDPYRAYVKYKGSRLQPCFHYGRYDTQAPMGDLDLDIDYHSVSSHPDEDLLLLQLRDQHQIRPCKVRGLTDTEMLDAEIQSFIASSFDEIDEDSTPSLDLFSSSYPHLSDDHPTTTTNTNTKTKTNTNNRKKKKNKNKNSSNNSNNNNQPNTAGNDYSNENSNHYNYNATNEVREDEQEEEEPKFAKFVADVLANNITYCSVSDMPEFDQFISPSLYDSALVFSNTTESLNVASLNAQSAFATDLSHFHSTLHQQTLTSSFSSSENCDNNGNNIIISSCNNSVNVDLYDPNRKYVDHIFVDEHTVPVHYTQYNQTSLYGAAEPLLLSATQQALISSTGSFNVEAFSTASLTDTSRLYFSQSSLPSLGSVVSEPSSSVSVTTISSSNDRLSDDDCDFTSLFD